MNKIELALEREAALAAEHLAIGVTALGKANYAHHAFYSLAFFALTIGFERAAKLVLVIDHALEHEGAFPESHVLYRDYGHDLSKLLNDVDEIARHRDLAIRLPRTDIHQGIIDVLTSFARDATRYYNLNYVTGNPRTDQKTDPIQSWYDCVIVPILKKHYGQRQRTQHRHDAELIDALIGGPMLDRYHSERGEELSSWYEASLLKAITDFAEPYARLYVMQIARFVGDALSELDHVAHRTTLTAIPDLSVFFAIFRNSDDSFKKRKTWSIYRSQCYRHENLSEGSRNSEWGPRCAVPPSFEIITAKLGGWF